MAFNNIPTVKMKKGDTAPSLDVDLIDIDKDGNEVDVNITGASVVFIMTPKGDTDTQKIARRAATITVANPASVSYDWQSGDTDTEGNFSGEFEVTFFDGSIMTYPREGYIPIKIGKDLG